MKKTINIIIALSLSIFFCTCKKDTGPVKEEPVKEPSARFKFITSHYWRYAENWQDTTVYGKSHPELIPLPSSVQVYFPVDSCQYYTSSFYKPSGWYYSVKKYGCSGCAYPHCEIAQATPWSLSEDEKSFNGPSGLYIIINVNDSIFSRYDYQIYSFNKKLINVFIHKAFIYK